MFDRSFLRSSSSAFDGDNDGKEERLVPKEHTTHAESNRVYYAIGLDSTAQIADEEQLRDHALYSIPHSWMNCPAHLSDCQFERGSPGSLMNIGIVPGHERPVIYRAEYTAVFSVRICE